jgi:hypothetical protein
MVFYSKKLVASPEKSKWRLYFSPNIFKSDIFVHFPLVFYILGKNKTFSCKFKMAELFNMKDDILMI